MSQNRSWQRFVDRPVEGVVQRLLPLLAKVFAHAVEDDDRVVERVSDDGQNRGDDRQRNLEVHQLDERQGREDVMACREKSRNGETPLEPDCQVDSRDKEGKQHRDHGVTP